MTDCGYQTGYRPRKFVADSTINWLVGGRLGRLCVGNLGHLYVLKFVSKFFSTSPLKAYLNMCHFSISSMTSGYNTGTLYSTSLSDLPELVHFGAFKIIRIFVLILYVRDAENKTINIYLSIFFIWSRFLHDWIQNILPSH